MFGVIFTPQNLLWHVLLYERFRVCCQFHFTVLVYSASGDLIELVIECAGYTKHQYTGCLKKNATEIQQAVVHRKRS